MSRTRRIRSIDVTAARAREGVVAVYTAEDLGDYWAPGPLLVPPPPIADITFNQRTQVPLAKDKIRHVGEPLAVVLAQSRYLAEDALADIAVDLEPLPAVVDLENALTDASAQGARRRARQCRRPRSAEPWQLHRGRMLAPIMSFPAAFTTITAVRRRSRPAASLPIGTPAPITSRSGIRPRRQCSCATGLPACSA